MKREIDPERAVLEQIRLREWNQERSVAFEVAREVIGDVIGAISGIVYHENRRAKPDGEPIDQLDAEQAEAAKAQLGLRSDDWEHIRGVTQAFGQRLRELDVRLDEYSGER